MFDTLAPANATCNTLLRVIEPHNVHVQFTVDGT